MKKLVFRLCISDITPLSRFLLLEKLVGFSLFIILSSLFYLFQFLSNFFKYSFSNFLSSHLYNIFVMYFPSNSSLLKSFSSTVRSTVWSIYSTSQISKLSLTLHTFSITSSVAGLFLTKFVSLSIEFTHFVHF